MKKVAIFTIVFWMVFQTGLALGGGSVTREQELEKLVKELARQNRELNRRLQSAEEELARIKKHEIKKYISLFREYNPNIFIKINTVVNKYNFKEKFHTFITETKPDKWKVLQALSINTDKIFCTEQQFNIFVENHKNLSFRTENEEDMKESYIMLDPYGRFYQNTDNKYSYSKSILDISPEKAFQQIKFDINKFHKRYN